MVYLMLLVVRVVLCVYMFMMFHSACLSSHLCHSQDSSALLHFKTQFIFNTSFFEYNDYYYEYEYECPYVYPKMSTWKNGTDCCSWMGVTCHSVSGHVIGLDLSCGAPVGNMNPNSTLFHLTHLQTLNLAFNFFNYSPFSSQFGRFVSLTHLNLSHCEFKGEIPSQISHLSKLQSLDFSWNDGLMWKETTWKRMLQNATALREIILDGTDMSSISLTTNPLSNWSFSFSSVTLSLPYTGISGNLTSHILCLPNLYELQLSNIQVHVPKLNCSASLSFLDLSWCQFPGSQIHDSFSNLTHLTSLYLSENEFNGSIPSLLSNLQHLTHLDLSWNAFTGSFPSFLSNLHHLVYLDLSWNKLSGQIPNAFGRLTNLQSLHLSCNKFQRKLPSSLFALTQLSSLDCSHNEIEGPLPDKVAFLNLTTLDLTGNLLNGTFSQWALSLKSLRYLDLSNNRFTGHISEITSYSLEHLDLCNNELHGNFPESIFHLVNLTDLCLSSDNWSGIVNFQLFSKLQNLEHLYLSGCSSLLLKSETSVNHTFSNLWELQLLSSNITGWLEFSGKFPNLDYLKLYNNSLQGKVPEWIHGMDSLAYLNLSHNNLTLVDHFPWYSLEILDLSFNSMADDISSFFCNATSLLVINLSHNKFTGTFPQCLANSSLLGDLDLQMNKLHGTLPDFTFQYLLTLNLNGNNFEGLLPKSLSKCSELVDLDLGNNQFEDTFPNWLQNLSKLEILVLRGNKLYGHIANLKSEKIFPSLIIFDISCNNFSGSLPKAYIQHFRAMKIVHDDVRSHMSYIQTYWAASDNAVYESSMVATIKRVSLTFTKIPYAFAIIDLSENKFEGEIPDDFGELGALIGLNLSHNSLIGPIPCSLGNLTNLESLDLSSNMLDGNIPTELANLNFLEVLSLSQNQLVGPIPKGKQFDTFSNDSYEGNMGLCGFPLSIQCNNVPLPQDPSYEAEDKFGFGWKPVAIGYACGMVLGIGLGFCVFSIEKPQWLVIIFGSKRIKRRSHANRHARTTLFRVLVVI
ncbi:receptor-like protein 35 [Arachis stenosperma]|uniref:receptor-like protein 35 n=1 Tax=Arachis stenosperma TaxID=217475 RepID=UPI0025AD4FBF|nr:receptor-like protein 35 [Arachis stenosperma]